jgi:cell division protein FtsA
MTLPREQPQARVTQADVASALAAVQRRALKEAVRQMSHELGVSEVNVKLVHSSVTSVQIDGYPVSNPLEFQGRVLELTVFNTFAPLTHIGALQTIAQELDLELVATVAEPYALAKGCATEEVMELGGIFVDVGGGTTDVAIVRRGAIESTRMFALGGRSFTKRLSTELNMSLEEAERFKIAHGEGRLPAEQKALAHTAVEGNAEVLAQGVVLTLEELGGDEVLPPTIYLAGGGSELPEVAEQLRKVNWQESLTFAQPPTIRVLTPADVAGIHDSSRLLVGTQDVTPMCLARHAVTLEDDADQPLGGLMRRVLKTMKV